MAAQVERRVHGEPMLGRLISLAAPDAKPIRKRKLGKSRKIRLRDPGLRASDNTEPGARG